MGEILKRSKESRYARQTALPEIEIEGQQKISKATVAVIGIGALGTVSAELLARAGVGTLILVDRDVVEETNLQRQMLFTEADVGRSKAVVAGEKIREINSSIAVEIQAIHLSSLNIKCLQKADLILDCTDNQKTRFLINDYCKLKKKKWIYAAAIKTEGYVMPIFPEGPCLRCFTKETELETCATAGVLGTTTTIIAGLQTTTALKVLLDKNVEEKLMQVNVWGNTLRLLTVGKNKNCPACSGNYEYLSKKEDEQKIIPFCSSSRFQIKGKPHHFTMLTKRWKKIDDVDNDGETLRFRNILLFKDGRALITAATAEEALSCYSEWIGN